MGDPIFQNVWPAVLPIRTAIGAMVIDAEADFDWKNPANIASAPC